MSTPVTITQISSSGIDRSGNITVVVLGADGSLWQGLWEPPKGPKVAEFVWQSLPVPTRP